MQKSILSILLSALLILFLSLPFAFHIPGALAHPGRTDANGGHTNKKTGEYHYHHGGRSSLQPSVPRKPSATKPARKSAPKATPAPPVRAEALLYGITNTPNVNVRELPETSARQVNRIEKKGTEIIITGTETDENDDVWYRIWLDGKEVYVFGSFIDIIKREKVS